MTNRAVRAFGVLVLASIATVACGRPTPSAAAPGSDVDVQRSALKTNVTVTVLDTDGAPQTGSDVNAQHTNGTVVTSGVVDAHGHAVIALNAGTYEFAVPGSPPGHGISFSSSTCVVPSCTSASVTVQKPVQVTALDGWGNPLVGVKIEAHDPSGNTANYDDTDDQGQVTLSLHPGTYQFVAAYGDGFFGSDPCTVPGCTTASIQIQKPVQVTVLDGCGGTRPGIHLAAVDTSGQADTFGMTDDSGQADMYLSPGAYFIQAEASDGSTFDSGPSGSCVVPGCTAVSITVMDVMVTVTASDGSPVTGQRVTAVMSDGTEVDWPNSNDQGQADAFVPPGAYKFRVVVGGVQYDSGPDGHCVVPGCRTAAINIPPPVVVTVVDGSGQPIANQDVTASRASSDVTYDCTTDAQGQATFTFPADAYQFSASCSGGTTFYSGDPGSCVVPGCTTARITMICGGCTGKPDGTACNDGNACTQTDTCQAGACVGSNPITCAASDQCHTAGTCDPASGTCSNPAKANGTACSDGNVCTQTDTCQGGTCTGGNPVTCVAQDQCHVAGTCNPSTGACSNPAVANGTSCNDGNACTQTDTCQSGTCTGGNPITCVAQDQCHGAGTCNPSTGSCSNPAATNGTSCNDGNACTVADACQGGTCSGTAVTCTAQDQCHGAGTCNPSTGTCSNPVVADGTACSDGNACTTGDSCQTGACVSGATTCTSLSVVQTDLGFLVQARPDVGNTFAASPTTAVPGDPVTFTVVVANSTTFVDSSADLALTNLATTPFVWGSYQVTLEYLPVVGGDWVPVAKTSFDATGAQSDDPPLAHLNFGFGTYVGQTIAPGQTAHFDATENATLPSDLINRLADPAEVSQVRVEVHLDTTDGTSGITADRDVTPSFRDTDAEIATNIAGDVFLGDQEGVSTRTDLSPATSTLAPGDSVTLTAVPTAMPVAPRQPSETDAQYLARLRSYNPYEALLELNVSGNGRVFVNLILPILGPQKSGPGQGNAGVILTYPVTLQNTGGADAKAIAIADTVDGNDAGGQISIPSLVAAGTTGTATIRAASPLGQSPGPYTDLATVTWQDHNGNVYGPVSSSFTTSLAAGHPEGYLTLVASGVTSAQIVGTSVTLTATALDSSGSPVVGLPVQLVIAGSNAQMVPLVIGADGTASFTYDGPNLGADVATVTATINGPTLTATAPAITWSTQGGPPCAGRSTPLDVMMLVDDSPSMFTEDTVAAVKAATTAFIDDLDPNLDQVGADVFMGFGIVDPGLTSDFASASAEIAQDIQDGVDACTGFCGGGTGYLFAFEAALNELQGPRHRSNATPLVVLLSDGGNTGPDYAAALAAVKAAGIRIISLGFGTNVDAATMRSIASSTNDYFYAPTSSELGWVYSNVVQDTCRSVPPLVSAGGDQGLYEVRLPAMLTLQGEAHGDGTRGDLGLTSTWTEVSGPAPVAFTNPSSPVTDVVFTEPGTYVLQLEVSDGFITTASRATVVVDPAPSLAGANLAVALSSPGLLSVGTPETLTATLTDAQSHPIGNFTVGVTVTGANPTSAFLTTNAAGVATFTYAGAAIGTDVLQATAIGGTAQLAGSPVSVAWTVSSGQGTAVSQGWIGSPAQQTMVKGLVPVTVAAGVTVVSATLSYWPATSPTDVHTLAINASGGPGATLATFDTTTLPNGSYVLALSGTDDHGTQQISAVLVTVTGDYKPGREVVTVNDFTVPVAGIPIQLGRQYDSLNKDKVGDFGNGWSLTVGHPDLQVDPANDVTITLPDGRRATFIFELFPVVAGPIVLEFLGLPTYVPEPGVFGTLTADGCALLSFDPDAPDPICFGAIDEAGLRYAPTTYKYTDAHGTVYTMGADGTLKTIQDRNNNILTFTADGITASTGGRAVAFTRDAQGRITHIVAGSLFNPDFGYNYTYDASGNLIEAEDPQARDGQVLYHYAYDDDHRLTSTIDPNGNHARTSTYDDAGRLTSVTDGLNNVTAYAYDVSGHTTTTTYPDTGVTTETFDDNGMLLSMTDQLGRTTKHQYDVNRNEVKRTNALNEVTTYTYDSNGNQTSSTNALGETVTTTYNAFSQPLTITNPVGNTTTVAYDDQGLPTALTDSMGALATFTTSEHGLPTSVTDTAGNIVFMAYDDSGDLTSRTDRLGRQTSYLYDDMGRKTQMTDPRGKVTLYAYDTLYYLRGTFLNPLGIGPGVEYDQAKNVAQSFIFGGVFPIQYTYDADNHLSSTFEDDPQQFIFVYHTRDFRNNELSTKDEVGNTTSSTYDLAGQLVQTTYADGTFTTQTYDVLGRLQTKTDERGNTTTYAYEPGCDCAVRLTSVTDPLGRTTSMTYDAMGRKTSMTDANRHQTSYAYDLRGHLIETDYADGTATHDTYDVLGRRTASADQTGATTHYGYDAEGQLISVTDPLSNLTQYGYDPNGNPTSVTDANNHTTTYVYDDANRKIGRTLPLGMTESFGYDAANDITSHTDFRGKTTTYTFDRRAPARLTSKVPDPSLGEPTVTYAYNENSTRSTMTDASGTTTYAYDTRNRLLTKATPEGTLTYTYDPSGNVASIDSSNANGTSVAYAWDAANQLVSITDNRLGGITTAAYTATGRPASLAQANGVGVSYAYDSLDHVTSMAWSRGAGAAFASFAYTYSPRGQRLTSTDLTGHEATYGYDAASRLISEIITSDPNGPGGSGALTYSLDPMGNRLSRTSTLVVLGAQSLSYDANDELTSGGYDPNGNTISFGGHTYSYDFEDRLISKDGGAVTIVYDGDGNRVAKTVGGVTTTYLSDDLNPTGYLQVADEVSNSLVQVRYTYGNTLISQTRAPSTAPATTFYGYDAHGDIAFLTDAAGTQTDTYFYDAFGNLVAQTGSTPNTRLYVGEEFDPDLGLINLRARRYSASSGRFFTLDPLDRRAGATAQNGTQANAGVARPFQLQSVNYFVYANADPVNNVDPAGREAEEEVALEDADEQAAAGIALGLNILNNAIHVADIVKMIAGLPAEESTIGNVECASAIDSSELILAAGGGVNGYVDLMLAGMNFACTIDAIVEEFPGGGKK